MQPRGLDGPELTISEDEDPRQKLVDWMVATDNPFFARAIANRFWGHFMGRGLVEPVDDMRVTNPPSNPELLDALAKDLVEHKFDLKHLIRTIMTSTTYQLSSEPTPGNIHDQQNYARAYPRRLLAEVMLDAHLPGDRQSGELPGLPKGTRAIQLPDEIGRLVLPRRRSAGRRARRPASANGRARPTWPRRCTCSTPPTLQSKVADPRRPARCVLKAKKTDAA